MPTGIAIPQRVVIDIRIPVPGLRALTLLGDDTVRLGEAPQGGVIPACIVKVQAEFRGVTVLPGVLVAGGGAAPSIPHLAPCGVAQLGKSLPICCVSQTS